MFSRRRHESYDKSIHATKYICNTVTESGILSQRSPIPSLSFYPLDGPDGSR